MASLAQQLVDAAVYTSLDDAIASASPGASVHKSLSGGTGDSGSGSRVAEQALEWCRGEAEAARGECEEERRARIVAEADLLEAKRCKTKSPKPQTLYRVLHAPTPYHKRPQTLSPPKSNFQAPSRNP